MIPFREIKTIYFDYDGTLHNSIHLYAPAFRKAYDFLVKAGAAENKEWTDKEISYWLGYNPSDMWKSFMPSLKDELRQQCSNIIGEEMIKLIEQGKSQLYEGAVEALEYLKRNGYHLIFISNCKAYYKAAHAKYFHLDHYFEELVCSEDYAFVSKDIILAKLKLNYPEKMLIVGDRNQDIEAGKKNNIYTIGCRYGYATEGELEEADLVIDHILDLKQLL